MLLALEIILFFLALLNLALLWVNGKEAFDYRKARAKLASDSEIAYERNITLVEMCFSSTATYSAKELEGGEWLVIRTAYDISPQLVVIKIFADEDKEFNKREAQELCDKLNEE